MDGMTEELNFSLRSKLLSFVLKYRFHKQKDRTSQITDARESFGSPGLYLHQVSFYIVDCCFLLMVKSMNLEDKATIR